MTIKVCVGSSCHLKGSYEVIEAFKEVLKKYDVEDIIDLQASFCLGHCALGVTVGCEGLEPSERGPQVEGQRDLPQTISELIRSFRENVCCEETNNFFN